MFFSLGSSLISRRPLAALLLTVASASAPAFSQNAQFLPNANIVAGTGGQGYTGDGGPALSATFARGAAFATMDPYGNIFVSDTANNVVRRIDAVTGIITTVAGLDAGATICTTTPTGGKPDAIGDGCLATQASLKAPGGIRIFRGDLYIADVSNDYIRKVSSATGIITVFAGTGVGTPVQAGTGPGAATATALNLPEDLVFDAHGNLYTVTGNGKPYIVRVDGTTGNVTLFAGNGVVGNTGDGGSATAAEIQTPQGLAVDPQGNLYISCPTPNTIRKVTLGVNGTANIISTYVGPSGGGTAGYGGDGGPANLAQLDLPQHIAVDPSGNLYIADQTNRRIRIVTPPANGATYGTINTYAGTGTPANSPSGTVAINANLNQPESVDITPAGDLIVMDSYNTEVKLIAPPVAATPTSVGSTVNYNASVKALVALTPNTFSIPSAYTNFTTGTSTNCTLGTALAASAICTIPITFKPKAAGILGAPLQFTDSLGDSLTLPLAGTGNAPVAAILPGLLSAVAGTGTAGNSGDTGPATAALLNEPLAIAVDALGNYFFADSANNEVREISTSGTITRIAGTGTAGFAGDNGAATSAMLSNPSGLAVDGAGNLYIADTGNNRIRKVSAGVITTFAGTGTAGYAGDGGPAASATLSAPHGLYLTPNGVLYVADTGNNVIRIIGTRAGNISTIAGNGTSGTGGYTGDTAQAADATLSSPTAVTMDIYGNVYIADTGNKVIRRIAASIATGTTASDCVEPSATTMTPPCSGIITTYAGTGSSGSVNGPAATASFVSPTGLAADTAGNLYVADTGNDELRLIAAGQVSTVSGTAGTATLTGNGGNSNLATLNAPQGVALDHAGNIVIADTANNQIRMISTASSSVAFPATNPGSTSSQTVSLINAGNLPLAVAGITLPAGFSEQPSGATDCNTAVLSLTPAAACEAEILFSPSAVQTYSGNVVLTDNSQSQTGSAQTIAVTGAGAYVFTASISSTPASPLVAGTTLSVTVSVTNPKATYLGTIQITSSDPTVPPVTYTFTSADNGVHVFSITLKTAGTQSITATDTTTSTIAASELVTVVGGPAASVTIVSGSNQSANINGTYTLPLVAKVIDDLGNPTSASVTFAAPTTGADVTFNGFSTYTATASSTLGTVTTPLPIADPVTGLFAVTATVAGLPAVSFNLTNTSSIPGGFTMTSNPAVVASLPPGTSATTVITITPVGGFNGPVNVACSGSIPTTSCTTSTSTVAPSGNGSPTTFSITVATTGPASGQLKTSHTSFYAGFFLFFLGVTLTGRKRRKWMMQIALTLCCALALANLSGCGNGNHTNTLPGSFILTVTGTSGSITNSVAITCNVAGVP